jgi:SRSO17 transposase
VIPVGVVLGPPTGQQPAGAAAVPGPSRRPHGRGALVVDGTGDRKDSTVTAHVGRQYLGSVGKLDNSTVAVTSLRASERCYWPVHAVPYTPA